MWNLSLFVLLWPPSGIGQAILFLSCGFFFLLLSFCHSFFFSWPNLSHRSLDVYHTSTHSVALVHARLKRAALSARSKCRTQKIAKNSPSAHHRTIFSGYIFATKARVDNRKKLVRQQYLLHMSSQYGELRPTNG